jgi:ribonuclease D
MELRPGPPQTISREELALLPLKAYEGPVHLVTHPDEERAAVDALRGETLLGFDTETRPSFVKGEVHPTALLQLAGSRAVYVFQLNRLGKLGAALELLADTAITKAGIALGDDLKKLRVDHAFEPAGFVEIAHLCRRARIKKTGLRPLAGMFLGFRISKREQRSNWGAPKLTPSQLRYAATDAWASREIYLRLRDLPSEPEPTSGEPWAPSN